MPLVVPSTTQVTIRGKISGTHNFANVFHVGQEGADVGPNGAAAAVLHQYLTAILPELCDNVTVNDAAYIDLDSPTGGTGAVFPASGDDTTGAITAPACPPNVTYLVRYGGVSERGVRNGRSYLPGVREDEIGGSGDLGDTWRGTMQTACSSFVSGVLADVGSPLLTVHHPGGGSVSTSEILGCLVDARVATQRRRNRS